jgi:hypothetical protein
VSETQDARDESPTVDVGLAVAAGPARWLGGADVPAVVVTVAVAAGLAGLAMVATTISVGWHAVEEDPAFGVPLRIAVSWAAAALLAATVVRAARPRGNAPSSPLAVDVGVRLVALGVLFGLAAPVFHGWANLVWWCWGLWFGADAALTLRAVGGRRLRLRPLRLFGSPTLQGSVVIAVGALLVSSQRFEVDTVLGLLLAAELALATSAATAWLISRIDDATTEAERSAREQGRLTEFRSRAHWIHDDVLADLRVSRLRLERDLGADGSIVQELAELDHRLRVRQLDEVLASGTATVAEIVQPYLRLASANGVELVEVPAYEVARITVDPAVGALLRRAVAVPLANAVGAGGRRVSVRVERCSEGWAVEIEDDAGGFEPDPSHAGRGLDQLRRDLGPDGVDIIRTGCGTKVRSRIPPVVQT